MSRSICWQLFRYLDSELAAVEFQRRCRCSSTMEIPKASFVQHSWSQGRQSQLEATPMDRSTMMQSFRRLVARTRQTPWDVFVAFQSNLSWRQSWSNQLKKATRWDEGDNVYLSNLIRLLSDQSLPSAWIPRVDGLVLKDNPQKLVLVGRWVAHLPIQWSSRDSLYAQVLPKFHSWRVSPSFILVLFILTTCLTLAVFRELRRRGDPFQVHYNDVRYIHAIHLTIFCCSLSSLNVTCVSFAMIWFYLQLNVYSCYHSTDDEFRGYINEIYFPNASSSDIALVEALYPADPTKGSPFNTGNNNTLTPQYKRISAFQGDVVCETVFACILLLMSSGL